MQIHAAESALTMFWEQMLQKTQTNKQTNKQKLWKQKPTTSDLRCRQILAWRGMAPVEHCCSAGPRHWTEHQAPTGWQQLCWPQGWLPAHVLSKAGPCAYGQQHQGTEQPQGQHCHPTTADCIAQQPAFTAAPPPAPLPHHQPLLGLCNYFESLQQNLSLSKDRNFRTPSSQCQSPRLISHTLLQHLCAVPAVSFEHTFLQSCCFTEMSFTPSPEWSILTASSKLFHTQEACSHPQHEICFPC